MDGKQEKTIRLNDGEPWRCENGHLMGVMRRERIARGKAKGYRLYLLKQTMEYIPMPDVSLAWRGRLEGTMRNIQCDCCDAERTWWAGKASLEKLTERYKPDTSQTTIDDQCRCKVLPVFAPELTEAAVSDE